MMKLKSSLDLDEEEDAENTGEIKLASRPRRTPPMRALEENGLVIRTEDLKVGSR